MPGLKRDQIDKYYTKETVVNICIETLTNYLFINDNELVIEPSAGNGAFISVIKELTNNYKFYDIEPENNEITKQNFLLLNNPEGIVHVIGNPPFGRQSNLAIKFIKKSAEFAYSICFILPKSFKKDSMKKHFPVNFHLEVEIDLPENSFLVNNKEHNVPCVFQIWIRKQQLREIKLKLEPSGYKFVKKNENPNLAFRRVGVNAGIISRDIENKSEQSHYFLKFNNIENIIEKIKNINFIENNTVGPKSISKQELIFLYNQALEN